MATGTVFACTTGIVIGRGIHELQRQSAYISGAALIFIGTLLVI